MQHQTKYMIEIIVRNNCEYLKVLFLRQSIYKKNILYNELV